MGQFSVKTLAFQGHISVEINSETAKGLPKLDFSYIRPRYGLIKGAGSLPFSSMISSISPTAILSGHNGVADHICCGLNEPATRERLRGHR